MNLSRSKRILKLSLSLIPILLSSNSYSYSVKCVELVLGDADLEIFSTQEARNICNRYTFSTILCAQRLDNRGTINRFDEGLITCNQDQSIGHQHFPANHQVEMGHAHLGHQQHSPSVFNPIPDHGQHQQHHHHGNIKAQIFNLANQAISLAQSMDRYTNSRDRSNFVLPLQKQGAMLRANINANLDNNIILLNLIHLFDILENNQYLINDTFDQMGFFEFAAQMVSMQAMAKTLINRLDNYQQADYGHQYF